MLDRPPVRPLSKQQSPDNVSPSRTLSIFRRGVYIFSSNVPYEFHSDVRVTYIRRFASNFESRVEARSTQYQNCRDGFFFLPKKKVHGSRTNSSVCEFRRRKLTLQRALCRSLAVSYVPVYSQLTRRTRHKRIFGPL